MKLAYKIPLIALLMSISLGVVASKLFYSKQEYSKTVKKEYSIAPNGTADLSNKYGNIEVQTWEKERVKVEVVILVRADNENKAQAIFDKIELNFDHSDDRVLASTEINAGSTWWGGGSVKGDFSIHYTVHIPETLNLEIENKYGNVTIAEYQGGAAIELKYGNLEAGGFGRDVSLEMGYGNVRVGQARDLNAEISNSVVEVGSLRDGKLETKYSQVSIGKARELWAESKYDEYKIGEAREFRMEASFCNMILRKLENLDVDARHSNLRVDVLRNSANLDLEHSVVDLLQVAKGFSEVRMLGEHTDYRVEVESGASYQLEASADYAGIVYPDGMEVSRAREAGVSQEVEGHIGTRNARSVIRARLDYGGLKLQ